MPTFSRLLLMLCLLAGFSRPAAAQLLYDDFETNRRVTYPSADGTLIQNAANPAPNTVNNSSTVARYIRNGANMYSTINIHPATAPRLADVTPYLNGTRRITMKMYSPAAGVAVQIVLQDRAKAATGYPNGNLGGTFNATTTVANAWETLTFTYAAGGGGTFDPTVPATGADQIALLIAFGVNSGATYHFDEMMGPEFVASTCNAAFTYPATAFCQSGSTTPTITGTAGGTFSSNGGAALNLNGTTGAINLTMSTPGTYNVTYTAGPACSNTVTISINTPPSATFSYAPNTYCTSSTGSPTPTLGAGSVAGTFTSTAGLTINATTGAITPSTSTAGTYTVTNTVPATGGCPSVTSTSTVIINTGMASSSAFTYPGTTFCQNGTTTPTITGTAGGTFTANGGAGLNLNGTTGEINLTMSTPGTYTVTYAVGGACPSSSTASVTVRVQPTGQFSYSPSAFCTSGAPSAAPTLGAGAVAGTFSSTSGLTINATTGVITPATSTPGTYTVTNTVAASGGCNATSGTTTVTIVSGSGTSSAFTYPSTTFCQAGTTSPTITGTMGGTFTANGGAGLSLNGTTGAINLTGSTPGTYTVTYTVGGTCTSSSTANLTIRVQPNAQFGYQPSTFCASGTASVSPVLGAGAAAGTFTFSSSAAVVLDGQVLANEGYNLLGTYSGSRGFGPHGLISLYAKSTATKVFVAVTGALEANGNSFQVYLNQPNKTGIAVGTALPLSNLMGTSFQANAAKMDFEVDYGFGVKGGATQSASTIIDYTRVTGTGAAARATDQLSSDLPNAGTAVNAPATLTGGLNGTRMAFKNMKDLPLHTGVEGWEIELDKATMNITDGAVLQLFAVQNNGDGGFYSTDFIPQNTTTITSNLGTNPDFTAIAGNQFASFTAASATGLTLNATTGAITPGTSTPGTYIVTNSVPAGGGCGPADNTTTVTINPLPSAAFSYPATAFCQSGNTTATITGAAGGTFTATGGAGLNLNGTTGAINLTMSTPGTYTVTYTVNGTCSNSSTASVTINQPANALFSYAAGSYCTSSTATPAPTLAAGGTAGTFTSTMGLTINGTTGAINPSTSTPGTYTVTNTVTVAGCAPSVGTTQVTINAAPATLTAATSANICQGSSVVLNGPTGTGLTYQFLLNGTAIMGATSASYTASVAGNYTVAVTNAAGCTATSPVVAVTVSPVTTATFSYPAATFCQNGTTSATVTGTAGGTFSSAVGLSINATTGAINLTGSTPGSYTVTYAVAGTCPSSSTFAVTVQPQTTSQFTYAAPAYCTSAAAATPTLTGSSVAGTFSSTTGLTINATTGAIDPSTSMPGTYTVTNAVAAANGCGPTASTTTVTINATPVRPTLTATSNGTTTTLTSSAATGNQFYYNGNIIAGATGTTYVVTTATQMGSYTVVVTGAGGCASQASAPQVVTASRSALAGTSLSIYPNPTPDGQLTVELRGYQQAVALTLFNALGQQVMARSLPAATVGAAQQLQLQGLANGVYVLRATTAGGTDTRRIVVGR